MSGNRVGRPPAAIAAGWSVRQAGLIALSAFVILFCAVAATAADTPNVAIAEDIELTKTAISLLAAKDIAAVRELIDTTKIQVSDQTLDKMAELVGQDVPDSVETIWSNGVHDLKTGAGFSRVVLEYGLAGKWVVVDAVLTDSDAAPSRFARFYLTVNAVPLRELNAFHLLGRGPVQYACLAGWILVIGLTASAMILAFRRNRGWRRWLLVVLMPLGVTPTVAINWITAQIWVLEANNAHVIPVIAFRYPMALFAYTELRAPFFYISAPLIAFGYLIWCRVSSRRPQPLASGADVFD